MEIIKEYWFLIVFVIGVVMSLIKALFDLNKTLSSLGYGVDRLNENFINIEKAQSETKDELCEHTEKLASHETRITVLEEIRRGFK